jgi:AcrR family transcriptional regulator
MSETREKTAAGGQKRNAEDTKRRILDAALEEFSTLGHAGARIDAIAERAKASKPMIYSYFGDKDALYKAALRESYVQIREGERNLNTDHMTPEEAIRELVRFTMNHFVEKPWFISMLNTENLRGGETARSMGDLAEIQSPLIEKLGEILRRGARQGVFRADIEPADFYITIASLCYFPVSNRHTLRAVFKKPIDEAWLAAKAEEAGEMLIRYLRPEGGDG